MKKKLIVTLGLLLAATAWAVDVKISQLPLGTATSTGSLDSFPYVSSTTNVTKRLGVWDLSNVPSIVSTYAPKANPTFTGVVTAPSFVGPLTGNASTATALAANPTDCSSGQYANAIAANGNLTCAAVAATQLTGTLAVGNGGTGLASGTSGGLLAFTGSTTIASTAAGSTGQLLRSAGTGSPVWTTATFPSTTTANQLLYSSATNTVGGLSTAGTGVLVTDSSGVPSIQACTTANRVLRTNGTALTCSQVAAATDVSGTLPVGNGGTGAATFTANGVLYGNTTSAIGVTATGNAGEVLTSNGSGAAPTFQTAASSSTYYKPVVQNFTSSGTYTRTYYFKITSGSATVGATYTNNAVTFTVAATVASATLVTMRGNGTPAASGTLTKASGTGDATITFSAFISPISARLLAVGGGGGGAVGVTGSGVGGGGGGGGGGTAIYEAMDPATLGTTQTITIGAGGASAGNGTATTIGALITGGFGSTGTTLTGGNAGKGGPAGVGTGGTTNFYGNDGGTGATGITSAINGTGGSGGGSSMGGGGLGNDSGNTGVAGHVYGGGGGGGGGGAGAGGAGAAGFAQIIEYYQ